MKKKYAIITVVLCAVVLLEAALLSGYWEKTSRDDTLKVGFVYSDDESAPFTANFIRAQRELEEVYAGKVETITRSNVLSREAEDPMRELIRAGCKILFINMDTDLPLTLAPEFPEVQFCQISLSGVATGDVPANYHTFNGEIYQARYVSGIVAGMKLRELLDSGALLPREALVGYVGANASPEVISGYTAFLLGVRSVAPEATMRVRYTGRWSNYGAEMKQTRKLIDEGCVIIAQHVNTTAPAAACEAAASEGRRVYHIGYHQSMMDVAPSAALIGIRINWLPYIRHAVEAVMNRAGIEDGLEAHVHGNDAGGGFENGWVEMLELNRFVAVAGMEEKMNRAVESIVRGKTTVFSGNYIGVNPLDPTDTIDLNQGFEENRDASYPSFAYILQDYITVEN